MTDYDVSIHSSIDELNENQWNNLVRQSDLGSLFHRAEWFRVVERTLDCVPRHIVVSTDGNPVAILPNFRTALYVPEWTDFTDQFPLTEVVSSRPGYGGPIISSDEGRCLELLLEEVDDIGGLNVMHTVRTNNLGFARYGKAFAKHGYKPLGVNCRFRIDLDREWESIRDDMDKERRRALRTMRDHDVQIRRERLDEDLDTTYDAYRKNIERADGSAFPRAFFEELHDQLGDAVTVEIVTVDGQDVGRFIYLHDDEQDTLHHYFAAIGDEDYFEYHPSELLTAAGIKWGKEQGYRYYDLGGTGADFSNSGFRYKERYGATLVPTIQWQTGLSLAWPAYKIARSLYRKSHY